MGMENTPQCYTSQKSQALIGLSKGSHNLKATQLISILREDSYLVGRGKLDNV